MLGITLIESTGYCPVLAEICCIQTGCVGIATSQIRDGVVERKCLIEGTCQIELAFLIGHLVDGVQCVGIICGYRMINLGSYLVAIDSCQYVGMLCGIRFIGCLNLGILAGSSKGHILTGCYVSYVNLAVVDGEVNVFCIVGSLICQLLCSAKHRNNAGICQVGCIEREHAHGCFITIQPAL